MSLGGFQVKGDSAYALMFGGQAGAASGLGKLLASWPGFDAWLEKVCAESAPDARWLLLEAPASIVTERFTAARMMVLYNHACAEMALARFGRPSALCGYSLGFYAAASAAGCAPLSIFLEWVDRVNAVNAVHCPKGAFGLAVSVGLKMEEVQRGFLDWGFNDLAISGINNVTQIVFAGPASQVDEAVSRLKAVALDARRLEMDVPLHCRHVAPSAEAVASWWSTVALAPPMRPLVSPVDGEVIETGEAFRDVMARSLVSPTNWVAVARRLSLLSPKVVMDASPGGDIGRMTRWTWREANVRPLP